MPYELSGIRRPGPPDDETIARGGASLKEYGNKGGGYLALSLNDMTRYNIMSTDQFDETWRRAICAGVIDPEAGPAKLEASRSS